MAANMPHDGAAMPHAPQGPSEPIAAKAAVTGPGADDGAVTRRKKIQTRLPQATKDRFARLAERNHLVYGWKVRRLARRADVFLVSFPKTGRTWLRVMLGRSLQRHFGLKGRNLLRYTAATVSHPGLPRILATHDDSPQAKRPDEMLTDKRAYRGSRVVFLVRDPRDVIVSLYHHRASWHRDSDDAYGGTLGEFLGESSGSFDSLLRFYEIWSENREVPAAFLLVRYEDLHTDPARELRRVLDFVGAGGVSDEIIEEAVKFAAFRNMQRLEDEGSLKTKALRVRDAKDPNARRVRRGRVGGHTDELSPELVAELDRRLAESGGPFGYGP